MSPACKWSQPTFPEVGSLFVKSQMVLNTPQPVLISTLWNHLIAKKKELQRISFIRRRARGCKEQNWRNPFPLLRLEEDWIMRRHNKTSTCPEGPSLLCSAAVELLVVFFINTCSLLRHTDENGRMGRSDDGSWPCEIRGKHPKPTLEVHSSVDKLDAETVQNLAS